MENKYYVPDISEFHPGFEFELQPTDYEEGDEWIKFTFGSYMPYDLDEEGWFGALQEHLKHNRIRCKFLDRQDIEELGWETKSNTMGLYAEKKRTDGRVTYLDYDEGKLSIGVIGDYDQEFNGFKGAIRNKSELARLMKMLNIE